MAAQLVKNLPAVWETWVQSLGWEDPLENSMDCIVHGVAKSQTQMSSFQFLVVRALRSSGKNS